MRERCLKMIKGGSSKEVVVAEVKAGEAGMEAMAGPLGVVDFQILGKEASFFQKRWDTYS